MQSLVLIWVIMRTQPSMQFCVLPFEYLFPLFFLTISQAIWVHLQDMESTVPSTTWHKHTYIITYPHLNQSQLRACPSDFISPE